MSDCSFLNGNGESGGAIFIHGEATMNMNKCRFERNSASKQGGAIFADSISSIQVSGFSTFTNNEGTTNGGDDLYI